PVGRELIPRRHVGEKISEPVDAVSTPREGGIAILHELRLRIELSSLARGDRFLKRIVEIKARLGNERRSERQVTVAQHPGWLVATHVPQLLKMIVRDLKQTAVLPLESFFRCAIGLPHGANTPALQHVDQLVQSESYGRQRF